VLGDRYQADYDVLAITSRLEEPLNGVTSGEMHLLAYLSCLLAVYRRVPASEWGYSFVRSGWGSPFSPEIERAIASLGARRFLVKSTDLTGGVRLTANGRQFTDFLAQRREHSWRNPFLDGACGSALAIPPGVIREALKQEPSLRQASIHRGTKALLELNHLKALYEHFGVLSEAVGLDVSDLMVPSIVWLTYLTEVQNAKDTTIAAADGATLPIDSTSDFHTDSVSGIAADREGNNA
jgi:hypothetical protein